MANGYLPRTDAKLIAFALNLSTQVTAAPVPLGLTAAIATQLASLLSTFQAKLALATGDLTKGKSATFAKNQAKEALIHYIQNNVVPTIQGTVTVTAQQKEDLGLTVKGLTPHTPIQPPVDPPVMEVAWMNGHSGRFKTRPAGSEGRSSRASGAAMLFVYSFVGATPPTDINDWKFEGPSSTAIFRVDFDPSVAVGAKVYVCCCWVTARGLTSPACAPVGLLIGGGVPQVG